MEDDGNLKRLDLPESPRTVRQKKRNPKVEDLGQHNSRSSLFFDLWTCMI